MRKHFGVQNKVRETEKNCLLFKQSRNDTDDYDQQQQRNNYRKDSGKEASESSSTTQRSVRPTNQKQDNKGTVGNERKQTVQDSSYESKRLFSHALRIPKKVRFATARDLLRLKTHQITRESKYITDRVDYQPLTQSSARMSQLSAAFRALNSW